MILLPRFRATLAWVSLLILAAPILSAAAPVKILQVGNGADPQDLDPQIITGIPEARLTRALFEGLVVLDASEKVAPGVAQSWDVSPDGLVYTFHLRSEARWSNGRPVTAHDFVRSYQRILSAGLGAQNAERLYLVAGAEDFHRGKLTDFARTGFKALAPHTLQLTLHQPATFLLNVMTMPEWMPVPIEVVEKAGPLTKPGNRWTRPENFVGNGPFALKNWRPGQRLVVTRSPTYWDRARVKLDEIHFHPVDNPNVEERMFRTGQLHVTNIVPLSKIATYRKEMPASLRIDPYGGLYYYVFNTQRPPFNDVRIRRALSFALDRAALVKNVALAGEEPAYSFVRPGLAAYPGTPTFAADLAEARRLLAAAGFPGGRGLPPVELLYNTSENHRAVAEAIQEMWRKNLGVAVTLTNQEWKVYLDVLNKSHDFQVARAGWISAEPHIHLERWQTGHATNQPQWSNADYDRLLRAALAAPTTEERYGHYREMEKILGAEMPVAPLYFYTLPRLMNPKVIGYRTTMEDAFPWKEVDLAP